MTRKWNINRQVHRTMVSECWTPYDVQGVCNGFRVDKIYVPDVPTKDLPKGVAGKILINGK